MIRAWLPALLPLAGLFLACAAQAQSPGLAGQDRIGAAPFGDHKPVLATPGQVPRSSLAPLDPVVQAWPRLEPGAVLCQSQQDLSRRAALLSKPESDDGARPDCHLVARAMGVTVLHYAGPGATQVRITRTGETGWTDSWLPDKP